MCSQNRLNCKELTTSMHCNVIDRFGRYLPDLGLVLELTAHIEPARVFSAYGKTYILDTLGCVFVLGSNSFHSLGIGPTSRFLGEAIVGQPLLVSMDSRAESQVCTQVAIGRGHTCFLMENGTIQCVGANGFCQCGFQDSKLVLQFPRQCAVPTPSAQEDMFITKISAGRLHTACLTRDGHVFAFGNLSFGSRNHMERTRVRPSVLPLNQRAIDVACGELSVIVLVEDGSIILLNRDHVDGIAMSPCVNSEEEIASIEAVSPTGLVFFAKSTQGNITFVQASSNREVITVKNAFEHQFEGRSATMDLQMTANERTVLLSLSQKRTVRAFVGRLASNRSQLCDCSVHTKEEDQ